MPNVTYEDWAARVVAYLEGDLIDKKLFQEAIASAATYYVCRHQDSNLIPKEAHKLLDWMRGDEPFETFTAGDTPQTYGKFLLEEWRLFGPEGE